MTRVSVISGLCAAATFLLPLMSAPGPAQALSLGRAMADGTICRHLLGRPHHHWGEGKTKASKSAAVADAVHSWSVFTRLEYGRKWQDWGYARDKSVSCKGGGSAWRCSVKAVPCKH